MAELQEHRIDSKKKFKGFISALGVAAAISMMINLPIFLWMPNEYVLFHQETLNDFFFSENPFAQLITGTLGAFTYANCNFYNWLFLTLFITSFTFKNKLKYLVQQKKGILIRGIEVVDNNKEFIKKITEAGENTAKRMGKSLLSKDIRAMGILFYLNYKKEQLLSLVLSGKVLNNYAMETFFKARIYLTKAQIPFFMDRETKGIFIFGGAGSGKTNALWDLMINLLRWMERTGKYYFWVVYDRKHDFWKKLYRQFSFTMTMSEYKKFQKNQWKKYDNGFATVSFKVIQKNGEELKILLKKDRQSIARTRQLLAQFSNDENVIIQMIIYKDLLFFPKDLKSLRWNWFDEFLKIKLIIKKKETNEIVTTVPCNTIRIAKEIYDSKTYKQYETETYNWRGIKVFKTVDIEETQLKDDEYFYIQKTLLPGFLSNLMLAFIPIPLEESSKSWVKRGRTGLDAVFTTVAFYYDFPSPKDFIDFTNQFNTRDALVERILELGFAKEYRSIQIESTMGKLDGSTEAGENGFENYEASSSDLRKTFYYYSADECDFSISALTPYIKNRYLDCRLFMVQDPENETEFKVVFQAMYELLGNTIILLPNDLGRRIVIVTDEAASLGRIDRVLKDLPQQARSKGAFLISGMQSLVDMKENYGENGMEAIMTNMKTRIYLAIEDNFTKKWITTNLGKNEYEVESESLNEEGLLKGNLSSSIQLRDVLTEAQLSNVEASEGYMHVGKYISKVYFEIPSLPDIATYEENTSLISTLPTEFDNESTSQHILRRTAVKEALEYLINNTNKNLSAENIAAQAKMSVNKVKLIIKEFNEEKEQVEAAADLIVKNKVYAKTPATAMNAFKKHTGLREDQIIWWIPKGFDGTKAVAELKNPKKEEKKVLVEKPKMIRNEDELYKSVKVENPVFTPENPFDDETLSVDELDELMNMSM